MAEKTDPGEFLGERVERKKILFHENRKRLAEKIKETGLMRGEVFSGIKAHRDRQTNQVGQPFSVSRTLEVEVRKTERKLINARANIKTPGDKSQRKRDL